MTDQLPYHQRFKLIKLGLLPKEAIPKPKKPIAKISPKKAEQNKQLALSKGDGEVDLFFQSMRKRCKGKCLFCGSPTTYKNEELWRIAIAHLLAKSKFKSVAVNENNWVELCWDCHTDFDNSKITWDMLYDSHEWLMLKEKLKLVLPLVAQEERKQKVYSKLESLIQQEINPFKS